MESTIIPIIIGAIALGAGIVLGRFIFAKNTKKQVEEAEQQAQNILKEAEMRAETLKKEKQLEAKYRFLRRFFFFLSIRQFPSAFRLQSKILTLGSQSL